MLFIIAGSGGSLQPSRAVINSSSMRVSSDDVLLYRTRAAEDRGNRISGSGFWCVLRRVNALEGEQERWKAADQERRKLNVSKSIEPPDVAAGKYPVCYENFYRPYEEKTKG